MTRTFLFLFSATITVVCHACSIHLLIWARQAPPPSAQDWDVCRISKSFIQIQISKISSCKMSDVYQNYDHVWIGSGSDLKNKHTKNKTVFVLFRVSNSDIGDILDNKKVISISINKTWQKDSTSQSVVTVIRSGCLLDSYRNETSDVSCCTWGKLVCVDLRV